MRLNDGPEGWGLKLHMARKPKKTAAEPVHFIAEWLVHQNRIQAELAAECGVDKGTVSRWCSGDLPELPNLRKIASFLECEVNDLFHRPGELWLVEKYRAQDDSGQKRLEAVLTNAFPD